MTNKIPAHGDRFVHGFDRSSQYGDAAAGHRRSRPPPPIPPCRWSTTSRSTGSAISPRRQVVDTAKCANCHMNLGFVHGGTRANVQECVICHNPTLSDGTSKQSVNFAWQIHSIHRGENLANQYVLGTTNYQEVRFPGDLRDCTYLPPRGHLPGGERRSPGERLPARAASPPPRRRSRLPARAATTIRPPLRTRSPIPPCSARAARLATAPAKSSPWTASTRESSSQPAFRLHGPGRRKSGCPARSF